MTAPHCATVEAAEAAFYQALEAADLEAMMAVWEASQEIVCIHPMGPRLCGVRAVRESWARIFGSGTRLRFRLSEIHSLGSGELWTRVVFENITVVDADEQPAQPVIATNIYRRSERGWQMVLHHASPGPARRQAPGPAPVLH